jgi:2-dehydropantoate 2-reductase
MTSYRLPAIFRGPPEDPATSYTPYVSPITAGLISQYTIPVIRETLGEMLAVGACHIYSASPLKALTLELKQAGRLVFLIPQMDYLLP